MAQIVLLNKPFNVLTQFRPDGERITLAQYVQDKSLRVAGRLDYDSEGLLLLTDDGHINQQLTHPKTKQFKTYLVQVDGVASDSSLRQLVEGVELKDGMTLPAEARIIDEPDWIWPRTPSIRFRANLPTSWLEIKICEGRNRQVRRMTAAVGLPTLRLIRSQIGPFSLLDLQPGKTRQLDSADYAFAQILTQASGRSASITQFKGTSTSDRDSDLRKTRRKTFPIGPRGR